MNATETKKRWVFWSGIVVGLIVTAAGIFALTWNEIGTIEARLILCIGLSIIVGAFGSTATIKLKEGVTIVGAAAIGIVFLYLLMTWGGSQTTYGYITGDIEGALIEVKGEHFFLGAMHDGNYKFAVSDDEFHRSVFDVFITFPGDVDGKGEREVHFQNIERKYIEKAFDSGRPIEWHFDDECLAEVGGDTLSRQTDLTLEFASITSAANRKSTWSFIGEALAQEAPRSFEEIFRDLGSGVASVRRAARNELASKGPNAVVPMMNELREHPTVYRIRLGVLVGLTTMLLNDINLAPEVKIKLSSEDLEIIVGSLNDLDSTIRFYTALFLNKLGDRRVIEPTLVLMRDLGCTEEVARYSAMVIKGAYDDLSHAEKQDVKKRLQEIRSRFGERTNSLIESFIQ